MTTTNPGHPSSFFTDVRLGIRTWMRSWSFIFSNGLTIYFIYPVVLSILLGMGAVALIKEAVDAILSLITPHLTYTPLDEKSIWSQTLSVLHDLSAYAVGFVIWLTALYTFSKIFKYLILALMSPVMARLSERTEEILTGQSLPFSFIQFTRDVFRGIAIAFRNLFMELFLGWALLAINLAASLVFPPAAILCALLLPVLSYGIGAYFYGFSTLDYIFERHRLSLRDSLRKMRSIKGIAVGNGLLFSLLFHIPFIGVSMATITCTVGAVLAVREKEVQGGWKISEPQADGPSLRRSA